MLIHDIALTLIPEVGTTRAHRLLEVFKTSEAVLKASAYDISNLADIKLSVAQDIEAKMKRDDIFIAADTELKFIEKNNITALHITDANYPQRLRECADAPILIYKKGALDLDQKHIISVVGTRHITSYGIDMCNEIIKDLAQQVSDVVIVSGLAFGVDIESEKCALKYGLKTVSVLGNNLREVTPEANRSTLTKLIEDGGAVVTEMNSSWKTQKTSFLQRNRIIAGLSDATVVIESAYKGGSLSTARCAIDYNREVMAVGGRATDKFSVGCNNLIKRNSAALITCADDIIKQLQWNASGLSNITNDIDMQSVALSSLSVNQKIVYDTLNLITPVSIDAILWKTSLPIGDVSLILMDLEMKNYIKATAGNNFIKI